MEFGKGNWRTFDQGIQKEWLLTNGIGGFASSTIIGANTRRYHGLLTASMKPPIQRHLILSNLNESVEIDGRVYQLSSFKTADFTMKGYHHLQRFTIDPLPQFTYRVEDIFLEKKICLVNGYNTVAIVYNIINGSNTLRLKLAPLINFRDYHGNSHRSHMSFKSILDKDAVLIKPYNMDMNIKLFCSEASFREGGNCWFENMYYPMEDERGLHCYEDHYIPGHFETEVKPGESKCITVTASFEDEVGSKDGLDIIRNEEARIKEILHNSGYCDSLALKLVKAADDFIVYRKSTDSKTVIAGYPWFSDWGRDTMIAFPGLTLATKRFDDAKQILLTFSKYEKSGLIPNMFPDDEQEPLYNSVDAALWYFEAVSKYVDYTEDYSFIQDSVYSTLERIIQAYMEGTIFNIRMDRDYLVTAGDENTQLTWMDAKVGDLVVTPRHGKAVEINALWYNALNVMEKIGARLGVNTTKYREMAESVKRSFEEVFWNENRGCLYDVVTTDRKDESIRSNQILAVSLSFPVMTGSNALSIVETVWRELYADYGLKSLSAEDSAYRGIYTGNQYERDTAYHQGTVWTWPLGHFIKAYVRTHGDSEETRQMAARFIEPFKDHLRDAGVGTISEIFDGDQPLIPRGCFAQAWSVGEILRAYTEDVGCEDCRSHQR